jgi:hypothetical protein
MERFEEEFKTFVEQKLTSRLRLFDIEWMPPETASSFKGRYA